MVDGRWQRFTGEVRPSDEAERVGPSVRVNVSGSPEHPLLPVESVGEDRGRLAVILVASVLVLLVAALGWIGRNDGADQQASLNPEGLQPTLPTNTDEQIGAPGPERIEIDPPAPPYDLSALPTVPAAWIDGLTLAWVSSDGLHIRDMATGGEVDLSGTPQVQIPPLPEDVVIVSATNESWAVVTDNVGGSGIISNTFETVRLADGVAAFGFVERNADDTATVFTGTLWGPSIRPILDVDDESTVFTAAGRGIVVSSPDGSGEIITMGEARPTPSRLGRVVGASPSHLAGVHCDAVGVCTGRLTDWSGDEVAVVSAEVLADGVVRLAPGGDVAVVWDGDEITLLGPDFQRSWTIEPGFNDSFVWDATTDRLLWVVDGQLLMLDPGEVEPQPHVVRSVGDVDLRPGGELVTILN